MNPAYFVVTALDADGNPASQQTFARPVLLLVWCEDGTCELFVRPDGTIQQYATTLRSMADSMEEHPGGYQEPRHEPGADERGR